MGFGSLRQSRGLLTDLAISQSGIRIFLTDLAGKIAL